MQQQRKLQRYLEELGERTREVQDNTHPTLQDEDNKEGISLLGHIFMSLIQPREHIDLPADLGDCVGPTGQ